VARRDTRGESEPPIGMVLRYGLWATLSAHNWMNSALLCARRCSCQPHEAGAAGRVRLLATAPD